MILYQLIGLHCYHLVLVVDVWVGEQSGFSGQRSDTISWHKQPGLIRRIQADPILQDQSLIFIGS